MDSEVEAEVVVVKCSRSRLTILDHPTHQVLVVVDTVVDTKVVVVDTKVVVLDRVVVGSVEIPLNEKSCMPKESVSRVSSLDIVRTSVQRWSLQ